MGEKHGGEMINEIISHYTESYDESKRLTDCFRPTRARPN